MLNVHFYKNHIMQPYKVNFACRC